MKCALAIAILAVLLGCASFVSSYFQGGWAAMKYRNTNNFSPEKIPDLTGKTAIVTGANTGIGKYTVKELARKGAYVVLASRSVEKGEAAKRDILEQLAGEGVHDVATNIAAQIVVMPLDLSSFESIRSFSAAFSRDSLDMFVANAGVMMCPFSKTKEGFEMQFGTNHVGHFLLVSLLKGKLAQGSRVVIVSSLAHALLAPSAGVVFERLDNDDGYDPQTAYGQSKLANVLHAKELHARLHPKGIIVNAVHPGIILTDLQRHIKHDFEQALGAPAVADFLHDIALKALLGQTDSWLEGALTQLEAATVTNASGRYFVPVGHDATDTWEASSKSRDLDLQKKLWDWTIQATDTASVWAE
eukprot:TRINITY_DN124128_c0_g1_i1.p1 TRINITY_DN124128_c0_g1~~TRINITY_DN124128_c0_g1_i1.p1  ORF type:complete len:358 (+),score=63.11 TRINITY_DN124128_c0_g1_i1:56-1129(+)